MYANVLILTLTVVLGLATISLASSTEYEYDYQVISGNHLQTNNLISSNTPAISSVSVNSLGNTLVQDQRKLQIPGTTHTVNIGPTELVIIDRERVLYQYSLYPKCDQPNNFYIKPSVTPEIIITCNNGFVFVVSASLADNEKYKTQHFKLPSVPAFVYNNNDLYLVYMIRGYLKRKQPTDQEGIVLYSRSEINTKFGSCAGSNWIPRSSNGSHFVLECFGKRFLVNGLQENRYCSVPSDGDLTIIKGRDEAVIRRPNSFTFYRNGFSVFCTISLPLPIVRIDYGIINNSTVLVFFNEDHIWVYNTGDGCKDKFLKNLANDSFPCLYGTCDGYYITDNGYLLVTLNDTGSYRIKLYNLVNVNDSPYQVLNLDRVPKGMNVVKRPLQSSTVDLITPSSTMHIDASSIFYDMSSSIFEPSPMISSTLPPPYTATDNIYDSLVLAVSPSVTTTKLSENTIETIVIPVVVIIVVIIFIFVLVSVVIWQCNCKKKKKLHTSIQASSSSNFNLHVHVISKSMDTSLGQMIPPTSDLHSIKNTTTNLSSPQPHITSDFHYPLGESVSRV